MTTPPKRKIPETMDDECKKEFLQVAKRCRTEHAYAYSSVATSMQVWALRAALAPPKIGKHMRVEL